MGKNPLRNIAQRYGTSTTTLFRHRSEHIPSKLAKAQEAQEVAQADDLLDQVRSLQTRALSILEKAEKTGALGIALGAIREARGNLELLAKLIGQLDDRPQVNILINPQWVSVRAVILDALQEHPEARVSVAQRLQQLEAAGGNS